MFPEPAYESPPPQGNTQDTAPGASVIGNVALTAPRTFPFDKRCPDISNVTRRTDSPQEARLLRRLVSRRGAFGTLSARSGLQPSLVGTLQFGLAVSTASGLARRLVGMPRAFSLVELIGLRVVLGLLS